ncbi:MAG TPA: cell division protein FtsQ/DivIB [Allosphingosinicella sp.]
MSAKIARGSPQRARPKGKQPVRGGKGRRSSSSHLLDSLPIPAETVKRISWYILLGMIGAVALALLSVFQVPQLIGTAAGEAIGEAGFAVKRVEVKGANRLDPMQAQYIAASQNSMAMPLVDLELTRERLLRLGWVREARVSRRWPDTLVVDIVERAPAAIWQHNQQLSLIDRDGVVLEPVKLDAMPDLPLVIGPAANAHATDLNQLLAAAPQLKPMLAGATWVGGRRWDLRFHSGEVLALPEGEETSEKALVYFARMDKMTQLLGKGLVRFDMRIPGKFIVRVSSEPGSIVPAELPPPAPPKAAPAPVNNGPVDPATVI